MKIDVLTLFPEMFSPLTTSIIGNAQEKGVVAINTIDFRQYSEDKHNHVDDYPYGGDAGMLLRVAPIYRALEAIDERIVNTPHPNSTTPHVILMDPAGETFNQKKAEELSNYDHLVLICGHYEGYDERIRHFVDEEISAGDFILTGGELVAMTVIDATVRLLEGGVGNHQSVETESFSTGLLEYPQYTRPREFKGMEVPDVLMSGNHQLVDQWRKKEALRRTYERRPDLLEHYPLDPEMKKWLKEFQLKTDK